jgi:hypothetical protein
MTELAGAAQIATDVTKKTLQTAETALRKVWSIMDAASEKKAPSEVLSQKGIQAMQGKSSG